MPGIYTTFSDDLFHYRCEGCGLCCQGYGFTLPGAQAARLKQAHPALEYFCGGDPRFQDVQNPGGCWFFQPSGLCGVEQTQGKDAKPFVCNLFPYELLARAGSRLIVSLNLLCPVSLEPGPGSVAISRAGAYRELARVDLELLSPTIEPFPESGVVLEIEGRIRDRCHGASRPADYPELAAEQWALYGIAPPHGAASELRAHLAEWQALLRFPESSPEARAEVTRVLAAVTPLLRVENAQLGPRQLPLFLLATYRYGLLSRELGATITPKRLGQIARDLAPLLTSISHLGDRPWLPPAKDLFDLETVPASLVASAGRVLALLRENKRQRLTWSEILIKSEAGTLHDTLDLLNLFALDRERVRFPLTGARPSRTTP